MKRATAPIDFTAFVDVEPLARAIEAFAGDCRRDPWAFVKATPDLLGRLRARLSPMDFRRVVQVGKPRAVRA